MKAQPKEDDYDDRRPFSGKNRERASGDIYEELQTSLDIWKTNPSFKDVNITYFKAKVFALLFITLFLIIASYLLNGNIGMAVILGLVSLMAYKGVFRKKGFTYGTKDAYQFHKMNPFRKISFFFSTAEPDQDTLYLINREELKTMGIGMFKIAVIGEDVEPNLWQTIKGLDAVQIPFSYQVVQNPSFHQDAFQITVYFSTFYASTGIIVRKTALEKISSTVQTNMNALKTALTSNMPHFKLKQLKGSELLAAVKGITFPELQFEPYDKEEPLSFYDKDYNIDWKGKTIYVSFILILSLVFLDILHLPLLLFMVLYGFLLCGILIIWPELLSYLSMGYLTHSSQVLFVDPFRQVEFYRANKYPYTLFLYYHNKMLMARQTYNLKQAYPYVQMKKEFCKPAKFYRALDERKIFFTYTVISTPLSYYLFNKQCYKYLKGREKGHYHRIRTEKQAYDWLGIRVGVWRTLFLVSASVYRPVDEIRIKDLEELEKDLTVNIKTLHSAFKQNFTAFILELLSGDKVLMGFMCESVKNKALTTSGTQLTYLMFQGAELMQLTSVEHEFLRGIESRIPAEFITPTYLQNFITIGDTFNTEFLEKEVSAGFLQEQVNRLLIVSGTVAERENLAMKIAAELVKQDTPCLIFDFGGIWSKLINYFTHSKWKDQFLYFKFGTTFIMDLVHSEIPYDAHNTEYLDYFLDAYAFAFKKEERTIELVKNTLVRNPDMDTSSLDLKFVNQPQQFNGKNPAQPSILSLFDEFNFAEFKYFCNTSEGGEGAAEENRAVSFIDFINTPKTVIIDLSVFRDNKKKLFLTFVILSKIIHYIKHEYTTFFPKTIFIPHSELFFDRYFLDRNLKYGTVDTFLEPLNGAGFGFVLSANQIRYLHHIILNAFENTIAFKSTDPQDVAFLKNQMNLQELLGMGFFTSTRKNTYQIGFLMTMKKNEILVKRSDISQPFPVILSLDENLLRAPVMSHEDMALYMEKHGYNLHTIEQCILSQTRLLLFEKDLGTYAPFLPEVITFLKGIKMVDQVGNIYLDKLKKDLMAHIYPKARKITNDKKKIEEMRNELLDILLRHRYLVEAHPKMASGAEALGTSYAVGEQYEKALEDYFKIKATAPPEVNIDLSQEFNRDEEQQEAEPLIEQYSFNAPEAPQDTETDIKHTANSLQEVLPKHLGGLYADLFQIYKFTERKQYENALKVVQEFVRKFLSNLYKELYPVDHIISDEELSTLIQQLGTLRGFPFNPKQLQSYLAYTTGLSMEEVEDKEKLFEKVYKELSDFYQQLKTRVEEK